MEKERVLSIRDLLISFDTANGTVNAICGMRFDVFKGETLAIVGESGSGKTVTVKAIMGIMSNNQHINGGEILYTYTNEAGEKVTADITKMTERQVRSKICGKHIAMVFQDPMTSLNPTVTVGKQIMEGMREHSKISLSEARQRAINLLDEVGIENPEKRFKQYPHQLSGGMRQRVVIAIALACDPDILICDEPTTALDVTIQWKFLELVKKLQAEKNLTVIYITHDLGVVAKVADFVCVMYAGRIIESGSIEEIYYDPRHPYTWGLLSSLPDLSTDSDRLFAIPGNPVNLLHKIKGDPFAPRNPFALKIDFEEEPPLFDVGGTHKVASWLCHPDAPIVAMPESLRTKIDRMIQEEG
jgi:oligopeptide transport system ATP-binding protein